MEKPNKKSSKYSPELRERAVRLVLDHQGECESEWAAINSIAINVDLYANLPLDWSAPLRLDHHEEEIKPLAG